MNKADLIDELARRMGGDHQLATEALENTLDIIVRTVAAGESITTGFRIREEGRAAASHHRPPGVDPCRPRRQYSVPVSISGVIQAPSRFRRGGWRP